MVGCPAPSVRGMAKNKKAAPEDQFQGDAAERNPIMSLPFSILLLILFPLAGWLSLEWPETVSQFPLMAAVPGGVLALFAVFGDGRAARVEILNCGGLSQALADAARRGYLTRALMFFGYLLAMIVLTLVIGQKLALPLFIGTYLIRWGNYSWKVALSYAGGGWLFLVLFYDQIMHLFWYQSWLYSWLPELLPAWLPDWLFV